MTQVRVTRVRKFVLYSDGDANFQQFLMDMPFQAGPDFGATFWFRFRIRFKFRFQFSHAFKVEI